MVSFERPRGRPGPGLEAIGAHAGVANIWWILRNQDRTRAGVSLSEGKGLYQINLQSVISGRARRSWEEAMTVSAVHRFAETGSHSFECVQPRHCLRNQNVCSLSKRRQNIDHQWSPSSGVSGTGFETHHQMGIGLDDQGRPMMVRPCPTGVEIRIHPTTGAGQDVTVPASL